MGKATLEMMDNIHNLVATQILEDLSSTDEDVRRSALKGAMDFLYKNKIEVGLVDEKGEVAKISEKVAQLAEANRADGNDDELVPTEELFNVLSG